MAGYCIEVGAGLIALICGYIHILYWSIFIPAEAAIGAAKLDPGRESTAPYDQPCNRQRSGDDK